MVNSFSKTNTKEDEDTTFLKGITQSKMDRVKTLNSFVNPEGGYLVPSGFSQELIREIFNETGNILSLAKKQQILEFISFT